jgi:F420-dependent oxidoreductase-like protein
MLLDYIGMVEDAGYEMIVVPELWGRDAFTFISQAIHVTSKIKFATGIVNLFSRSPATLAMTAASLSELSDGRFILGLGLSGPIVIEQLHGVKFEKPIQRTREVIQIIRTLLSGERLDHKEEVFQVERFKLMFKPEYEIPIYVAALGPKNLTLTGELADGWYPIWSPKSRFNELKAPLDAGLEKSNRSRQDLTIAPFLISCASEDSSLTTDLARKHIAYYIGRMGTFYYELAKRHGYENEANNIRNLYPKDRNAAAKVISDKMLEDIAITGNIEEAKAKMAEWDKLVDIPLLFLPFKTPPEIAFETIQTFAP